MRLHWLVTLAVVPLLAASPAVAEVPVAVDNSDGSAGFEVAGTYPCAQDPSGPENCGTMELEISFRGRGVSDEFFEIAGGSVIGLVYEWRSCKDAGVHEWTVTYTAPDGTTDDASGAFRVPRCKPPRWRFVSYGTAARTAMRLPSDDWIDGVKCARLRPARRTTAGEWACGVTSHNLYRVCNRYYKMDFYKEATDGGWGRYINQWSWWRFKRTQCWSF